MKTLDSFDRACKRPVSVSAFSEKFGLAAGRSMRPEKLTQVISDLRSVSGNRQRRCGEDSIGYERNLKERPDLSRAQISGWPR
jgi:hypothetical protein